MRSLKGILQHSGKHDVIQVDISLSIEPKLPDLPYFPDAVNFRFKVYDYDKYVMCKGYCIGKDAVSHSIIEQGVWEGCETRLFVQLLKEGNKDNKILDFGAQIGWYSVIAGLKGYDVVAYDDLAENIEMINSNAKLNGCESRIFTEHGIVDWNSRVIDDDIDVEVMKCDLEGMDVYAVDKCSKLFKEKRIKYALIEISPIFNDSYPDLVEYIYSCGYSVYLIPEKNRKYLDEYSLDPLGTIKKYCHITKHKDFVKTLRQENFLFIRDD